MANNYLQFSEVIPNLTPDEEVWLKQQFGLIAVRDGQTREIADQDDEATAGAEWIGPRFLQDYQDYDPSDCGPDFGYEFDDDGPSNWGRHLWVYGDEYGDPGQVAHLVQKLLGQFRPDHCWSLTYAETCSKLRVGEFSGGAVFVTADEIRLCNAYGFIEEQRRVFGDRQRGTRPDALRADEPHQGAGGPGH